MDFNINVVKSILNNLLDHARAQTPTNSQMNKMFFVAVDGEPTDIVERNSKSYLECVLCDNAEVASILFFIQKLLLKDSIIDTLRFHYNQFNGPQFNTNLIKYITSTIKVHNFNLNTGKSLSVTTYVDSRDVDMYCLKRVKNMCNNYINQISMDMS